MQHLAPVQNKDREIFMDVLRDFSSGILLPILMPVSAGTGMMASL
jgi:hypothetical protein